MSTVKSTVKAIVGDSRQMQQTLIEVSYLIKEATQLNFNMADNMTGGLERDNDALQDILNKLQSIIG